MQEVYYATAPNQVWSRDITFLPAQTKGRFYKLYLIEDIFSRYPVGWEVHEEETGKLAAELLQRTVTGQSCTMTPLVLHSDHWYSHEHRHSGIQFVTPAERASGTR